VHYQRAKENSVVCNVRCWWNLYFARIYPFFGDFAESLANMVLIEDCLWQIYIVGLRFSENMLELLRFCLFLGCSLFSVARL